MKNSGMIHVYTGEGKGKTTAAFGLALRGAGQGLSVCIIQFLKGGELPGEVKALHDFPGIRIYRFGSGEFINTENIPTEEKFHAAHGIDFAKSIITIRKYKMIILDEITLAAFYHLVPVEDIIWLCENKPPDVELIITGRSAPSQLLEKADLVTRMQCVKHYAEKGIAARRGIEF